MYGDKKFEVPAKAIDKFKEWNSHPETQNVKYDKRIVHALVVMLGKTAVINGSQVNPDAKEFIKGNVII